MIIARADSPEFKAALPETEFLVGLGESEDGRRVLQGGPPSSG